MSQSDPHDTWIYICKMDELDNIDDDEGIKVVVDHGAVVAVFRVKGEFYVIEDLCTHGKASLSEGFLDDYDIECPFHGGKFDIRTGEATAFPCATAIIVYDVKTDGGIVYAQVSVDARQKAEEANVE